MPRPTATPGPETRAILTDLIDLWDSNGGRPFKLRTGLQLSNGLMIHTLAHHTAKLSKAILIGAEAGLDVELIPQVRLSMECAMTAAWLVVAQEGGEALTHEGTRQRRAVMEGMQLYGYETQAQLDEEKLALDQLQASPPGRYFEKRCRSLVGGEQMYLTYRAASAYSHAGMAIADHYLEQVPVTEDSPVGLVMNLGAELETIETWSGVQAAMLLLAELACDRARLKSHHKTQLQKIAKRLGVGTEIRLVDDEPEATHQ